MRHWMRRLTAQIGSARWVWVRFHHAVASHLLIAGDICISKPYSRFEAWHWTKTARRKCPRSRTQCSRMSLNSMLVDRSITRVMARWRAFQIRYSGSCSPTAKVPQTTYPGTLEDVTLSTEMGFCSGTFWITLETSKSFSPTTSPRKEGWKERLNTFSCRIWSNFYRQTIRNSSQTTYIAAILTTGRAARGSTRPTLWTGGTATSPSPSKACAPAGGERVKATPKPKSCQGSSSAAGLASPKKFSETPWMRTGIRTDHRTDTHAGFTSSSDSWRERLTCCQRAAFTSWPATRPWLRPRLVTTRMTGSGPITRNTSSTVSEPIMSPCVSFLFRFSWIVRCDTANP